MDKERVVTSIELSMPQSYLAATSIFHVMVFYLLLHSFTGATTLFGILSKRFLFMFIIQRQFGSNIPPTSQ